jgi:hypothetical protein
LADGLAEAQQRYPSDDTEAIIAFIRASERGVTGFG